MEDVDLRHAKEHLEELIVRAARGEEITIAHPTLGAVRLQPVGGGPKAAELPPRVPGLMKGLAEISDMDLLAPLTEEELRWLSGEDSP